MIRIQLVDVDVDVGLDRQLADQVEPYWRSRLAPTAEQLARQSAPVESGELRARTYATVVDVEGTPVMVVGSEAPHFRYVEYGTRHMDPQPFARPAAFGAVADHFGLGG